MGANYDEVFSINSAKMLNCSKQGWLCGYINETNNEIIAVTCCQDLIDYVETIYTHNCQFVKIMDRYAWQTEGELFKSLMPTLKRGDCSYIIFGGVKKELAKKGISRKFWAEELAYLKLAGYKDVYARATSRYTTKLLGMFGGKVINTVIIEEKGINSEFMAMGTYYNI